MFKTDLLLKRLVLLLAIGLFSNVTTAQETLPIYTDYLSDNVYLLHPAAAGVGDTGKIRLTARNQWQGVANAPNLQTLSAHNRFGERTGVGLVLFNDENGNFSQQGLQGTYAYHLNLSNRRSGFQQLSFALSLSVVQNKIDNSGFNPNTTDPVLLSLSNSDAYYNGDFGVAYHYNSFFSYLTVKNLFLTTKTAAQLDPLNLRKFLFSAGYFFGNENKLQYEPSFMVMYEDHFKRIVADVNLKVYKNFYQSQIWGAVSYRRSEGGPGDSSLQYAAAIVGLNYNKYMISYTYTEQLSSLGLVPEGGQHQITLGVNIFNRKRSRLAVCPNINHGF